MNLEDLRIFIEVADTGGVAQGARRLGVSKSIVSRRLVQLEQELGAQLLARTTRGSTLTEAGSSFREHAVRVIAELDAAQESLTPAGEIRGLLRVAAPLTFGITKLAPVFGQLMRRHPQLSLDVSYSDRFVDIQGEGYDCAVRLGALADSSLVARRICTFRGSIVASPAYLDAHGAPRTVGDLVLHQAVIQKGEVWPFDDKGKAITIRPRARMTTDNGEAVLAAALAGIGIAALPDFLVEAHVKSGSLVKMLKDHPTRQAAMYVVRPPSAFALRKVRALIDILVEHFGEIGFRSGAQ